MIIALRACENDLFRGLQVFTLKDWHEPIDEIGNACFDVFDEALEKLKSDPDATRIRDSALIDSEVTRLNTATETALRSVAVKHSETVGLYTVAFSRSEDRKIYFRLPPWLHLQTETLHGDFHVLKFSDQDSTWREFTLLPEESALHLRAFHAEGCPPIGRVLERAFYRFSDLFSKQSPFRDNIPFYVFAKGATP